jgi:hypothetical protein
MPDRADVLQGTLDLLILAPGHGADRLGLLRLKHSAGVSW